MNDPEFSPCVYRAYGPDGKLLYVGSTESFGLRREQHERRAKWYQPEIRWTTRIYASIAEAKEAELEAIAAEHPIRNVRGRTDGEPATVDLAEIDNLALAQHAEGQRAIIAALRLAKNSDSAPVVRTFVTRRYFSPVADDLDRLPEDRVIGRSA